MVPRTRNSSRGRGRGRGSIRGGRTAQPSRSPTPPREEEVPVVQTPGTVNIAQVGDALRNLVDGFMATLTQSIPTTTPPVVTQAEQTRGVPQAALVPPATSLNRRAQAGTPPVVNVPIVRDNVEYETAQDTNYLNLRREFNSLKPDFFDGSKGPSFADTWLDTVEEELDILRVPSHYRVSITVGRLSHRAREWWRAAKSLHGDEALVWTNFRRLFLDEYVSKAHREEKCKELDRLQQGSMTVEEYRLKFEELCVYKDSFIAFPEEKMNKFIDGLR